MICTLYGWRNELRAVSFRYLNSAKGWSSLTEIEVFSVEIGREFDLCALAIGKSDDLSVGGNVLLRYRPIIGKVKGEFWKRYTVYIFKFCGIGLC